MEIEGLERKQHENPYGYTDDQLLEKQLALKTMQELYPNVPKFYCELVYDMCKNKTQEEIDEIKHKVETTPFKYGTYSHLESLLISD